jgi:hypothetical protein
MPPPPPPPAISPSGIKAYKKYYTTSIITSLQPQGQHIMLVNGTLGVENP